MVYDKNAQEMITLNVRSNNKNNLTLTSASIEITDKLSNNITIPVFDFVAFAEEGSILRITVT